MVFCFFRPGLPCAERCRRRCRLRLWRLWRSDPPRRVWTSLGLRLHCCLRKATASDGANRSRSVDLFVACRYLAPKADPFGEAPGGGGSTYAQTPAHWPWHETSAQRIRAPHPLQYLHTVSSGGKRAECPHCRPRQQCWASTTACSILCSNRARGG